MVGQLRLKPWCPNILSYTIYNSFRTHKYAHSWWYVEGPFFWWWSPWDICGHFAVFFFGKNYIHTVWGISTFGRFFSNHLWHKLQRRKHPCLHIEIRSWNCHCSMSLFLLCGFFSRFHETLFTVGVVLHIITRLKSLLPVIFAWFVALEFGNCMKLHHRW